MKLKTLKLFILITLFVFAASCASPESSPLKTAPNFKFTDEESGNLIFLSEYVSRYDQTVILFYRGHFWGICQKQLVELQYSLSEFQEENTSLIAISKDTFEQAQLVKLITQAEYMILPDPEANVLKEYGVFDLLGDGVAAPAVFIINPDMTIYWSYISKDIRDRPTTDEILQKIN